MPGPLPGRGEPCDHCGLKPISRPRRLCWNCYYTPGLREKHACLDTPFAVRGVADRCGVQPEDAVPLTAGPGTQERLLALAERARKGLSLFRKGDAGWEANVGLDLYTIGNRSPQGRRAGK